MQKKTLLLIVLFFGLQILPAQSEYTLELVDRIWFDSDISFSGDTTGGSDVWGYTAPDGEEYALMGVLDGIAIVRVSDMEVIDIVPGPTGNDYYYHRDIKTYSHYAYAVAEMYGTNQGLMIIDLSPLPDSVRFVGSYINGSDIRSHNLSIDTATGYAYIGKQNYTGFRVVNLADPENPEDVITVSASNIHDVYARNDTVYVAEGYSHSFSIFDLSDKENPQLLARVDVPNPGYVHNIWPTDDGTHIMTTEETTGKTVKMWNIEDMENIEVVGEYLGVNSLAHNTHIMGDFAYISHYTVGVTVVDISDPTNLIEVAQYDTYPLNDNSSFHGCWGAYPFTQNGMVFTSDLEGYLTVLQFTETDTSVFVDEPAQIPNKVVLHQNYPNPFNPVTTISYDLSEAGNVNLVIVNLMGREVRTLVSSWQEAGHRSVLWDGNDENGQNMSAGIYLYKIQASGFTKTQKLVLLK
ncbi:MAG: choice-of-anchor B family protein [Candidatus Marinimicrobia bacterium]|nr:choice-of-anchor B family protein [Candidatus Neomarinimicrobiota bacterium]